jgi:phytanoyl-CoA hydroxylase
MHLQFNGTSLWSYRVITVMLTSAQILAFQRDGYIVVRAFSARSWCEQIVSFVKEELARQAMPIEFEADTRYPGAPESRTAEGGATARRLLMAAERDPELLGWATGEPLKTLLIQLLGMGVVLSQAHHNCIMTKQPAFSSTTGWHRDSRYWHFARPELVSAWLALGDEQPENGCLWVIPGSHRVAINTDQLDQYQFLRTDLTANESLLNAALAVPLSQGDLLLFHSNLFHAAGRNTTDMTKFSMVFTYRSADNPPAAGTRSALTPEIPLV